MPYGPADAVDPGTLKRALVIKLRHHGDVLLASPMFSVLRNRAPQLEIDALVYADTREMLSLHPAIAQVHVVERSWKAGEGLRLGGALAFFNSDSYNRGRAFIVNAWYITTLWFTLDMVSSPA